MLSTDKRNEVRSKITAFLGTVDVKRVTAQQAYDTLYPDQVDFGFFHQMWQHVLRGEAEEAEHAALLQRVTATPDPIPNRSDAADEKQPAADGQAAAVPQNDAPSPPAA